jgi:16S rRNA (guanine(966)-N(2))-methyltransferase RsmD
VREALFSALAARLDFEDMAVLDLYAGSGALGLEALSRGAARATFVEENPRTAAVIEANVATLGFTGATVLARPVATVLAAGADAPVDLVLADPPYNTAVDEVNATLARLAAGGWTDSGTVVAVERRTSSPALTWSDGWDVWPMRRYGDTRLEIAESV